MHDSEADAIREAQAGVVQTLVDIEGRLFQSLVRTNDMDDSAGQEQAREADSPRGAEPGSDQRDRLVEDVMCREQSGPVPQAPALNGPGLPVVSVARVFQGVEGRSVDEDAREGFSVR